MLLRRPCRKSKRPKNLRKKFFQKLEEGVDARFDERLFTHINSVQLFFNAYDEFFIRDLEVVQEQLDGCFPPDYNIVDTYAPFASPPPFLCNGGKHRLCCATRRYAGAA